MIAANRAACPCAWARCRRCSRGNATPVSSRGIAEASHAIEVKKQGGIHMNFFDAPVAVCALTHALFPGTRKPCRRRTRHCFTRCSPRPSAGRPRVDGCVPDRRRTPRPDQGANIGAGLLLLPLLGLGIPWSVPFLIDQYRFRPAAGGVRGGRKHRAAARRPARRPPTGPPAGVSGRRRVQ